MMSKIMAENEMLKIKMEEVSPTTTLPQEIIIEILSWLPTKSLVTSFKLMCKAWRTLIKDPYFVKMHLNRGAIHAGGGGGGGGGGRRRVSSNNNSLICKSGNELFQFHPPFNFEGILPSAIAAAATTKLDFDSSLLLGSRLVGSCNGLLCLSIKHNESTIIILLNPSTRRFKVSPEQPTGFHREVYKYWNARYGFGCYNSTNNVDEYKVVRITHLFSIDNDIFSSYQYHFDIYSMSSNSWRRETKLEDFPYIMAHLSGIFVNGALHWMGFGYSAGVPSGEWDTIVSFDIRDEEVRQIPFPLSFEPTADDPDLHMGDILMSMKGCLSMFRFSCNNNIDVDLGIWVMKEYGIKESWTKEFVIRSADSDPPRALSELEISWRSNAYVLKGDQILVKMMKDTNPDSYREKLVLYDINERKIDGDFKMVGVPDEPSVDQVGYIETLVSLKSLLLH